MALNVEDIEDRGPDGISLKVRRSKTDQEGRGTEIGVPSGRRESTYPARALAAWLDAANIDEGPIFRPVERGNDVGRDRLSDNATGAVGS